MKTKELKNYLQQRLAMDSGILSDNILSEPFVADTLKVLADTVEEIRSKLDADVNQWFWDAWNLSVFTENEQNLLKYYYQLKSAITTKEQVAHCLRTALGVPFRVKKPLTYRKKKEYEGFVIGDSYLELNSQVGGQAFLPNPVYQISIGPLENNELSEWLIGERKRWFLAHAFLPLILPKDSLFEIKIIPNEMVSCVSSDDCVSIIGVNFMCS